MWTGRLRYFGFGLLLLGLLGALLLTWLLFNVVVFSVFGSASVFFLLLSWVIWDGVRQTSPESLRARGVNLDDGALRIMDPGLRREFSPFLLPNGRVPSARRVSGRPAPSHGKPSTGNGQESAETAHGPHGARC